MSSAHSSGRPADNEEMRCDMLSNIALSMIWSMWLAFLLFKAFYELISRWANLDILNADVPRLDSLYCFFFLVARFPSFRLHVPLPDNENSRCCYARVR